MHGRGGEGMGWDGREEEMGGRKRWEGGRKGGREGWLADWLPS